MKIKFTRRESLGMLEKLASKIGGRVRDGTLRIPGSAGGGYLKGMILSPDLRLMIRDHYLNEDLRIERPVVSNEENSIIFSFNNLFATSVISTKKNNIDSNSRPSIQVFSQKVAYNILVPAQTIMRSITIGISNKYLGDFIERRDHPILKTILEGSQNFAFESGATLKIQKAVTDTVSEQLPAELRRLWYHSKCLELLSLFFERLIERKTEPVTEYHINDLNAIYRIKDVIDKNPGVVPVVSRLATDAGMSQPKLRKLFRQTFGYSVYDYFQLIRIQEAAKLFREKRLSVSEVGYLAGFTNLSHFTRVFERHMGMKPKRWSMELR